MTDSAPFPTAAAASPHRLRLIEALAATLAEKAYADITVADVVARAHVSKRTFYEQFDSKEACLLALCDTMSQQTLAQIAASYDHNADWVQQLEQVTRNYLGSLQAQPALLRTLFIEVYALGPAGLQARRQVQRTFADFLRLQVDIARLREPDKRPLDATLAMAVVGGISELILHAVEEGRADRLVDLTPTVTTFVQAVLESLLPPDHRLRGDAV
ncbi:MAG TPA: TetR/AcrR family transcriptional regulator [Candidatus Aquabacterium excrementipullorum]|nr:TetR/AcrR family transcriptional regulator [Candidatus Aquabacterium excrementipullorum]